MKVKIETTITLNADQVKAARMRFESFGEEGESFRDFIKSNAVAYAHGWVDEAMDEWMAWNFPTPNQRGDA